MSGEIPIQVVVAAFQDERAAGEALEALKGAQQAGLIKIDDAAVLRRDANNKLHIMETADMRGGKGAVFGGVTGAVIGLMAGPVGWAAGIGALVGGLAAKLRDAGFPDERLRTLGAGLKPGTSAIVAVVEHTWVRQVQQELEKEGADVLVEGLRRDIAGQLEAGNEIAYTALSASGALYAERAVSGKDYVQVDVVAADDQGVYAGSAAITGQGTAGGEAAPPAGGGAPGEALPPAGGQSQTSPPPSQPPAGDR